MPAPPVTHGPASAARIGRAFDTRTASLRPPAAHEPDVQRQQQRGGEQREERPRPGERHQTIRPNQRSISTPPSEQQGDGGDAKHGR